MFRLRKLKEKDIYLILEWMKDSDINQYFRFNPEDINFDTVYKFICDSQNDELNKHFAIVDDNDEYLGTVSIKNIDYENENTEYAISLRKCAMGKGVAAFATKSIINIAFEELNLKRVYLNVLSDNTRAIKFYEKIGFTYEGEFIKHIKINGQAKNLKWYSMIK